MDTGDIDPYLVERVFDHGMTFSMGDHDGHLEVRPIASLVCPSGQIVAGDPQNVISPQETPAFDKSILPGTYPCDVAVACFTEHNDVPGELIASARIRVAEPRTERVKIRPPPTSAYWL